MEEIKIKDVLLRYIRAILVDTGRSSSRESTVAAGAYQRTLLDVVKRDPEVEKYLALVMPEVYQTARQDGISGPPLQGYEHYPPESPPWTLHQIIFGSYDYDQVTGIPPLLHLEHHVYRYTGPL